MYRRALIRLSIACVTVIASFILVSLAVAAQADKEKKPPTPPGLDGKGKPPSTPPIYNPYPPGILPADLESEIERVLREIDVIENRAIQRWRSLPPPTRPAVRPGPNPPVL
jgi:hypothetical protein